MQYRFRKRDEAARPQAMRAFSAGAPAQVKSTFMLKLKRYFWICAPLLLIIIITAIGATWTILANTQTDPPKQETSQGEQKPRHSILGLLNEASLIDAYIEASAEGGRATLSNINSTRCIGKIYWNERSQDYTLTKRRPNLMLLELTEADSKITYGYDGNTFWQERALNGAAPTAEPVSKLDAETVRNMARFFDPLLTYALEGGGILQVIEFDDYLGASAIRVQLRGPNSNRLDIWLFVKSCEESG